MIFSHLITSISESRLCNTREQQCFFLQTQPGRRFGDSFFLSSLRRNSQTSDDRLVTIMLFTSVRRIFRPKRRQLKSFNERPNVACVHRLFLSRREDCRIGRAAVLRRSTGDGDRDLEFRFPPLIPPPKAHPGNGNSVPGRPTPRQPPGTSRPGTATAFVSDHGRGRG